MYLITVAAAKNAVRRPQASLRRPYLHTRVPPRAAGESMRSGTLARFLAVGSGRRHARPGGPLVGAADTNASCARSVFDGEFLLDASQRGPEPGDVKSGQDREIPARFNFGSHTSYTTGQIEQVPCSVGAKWSSKFFHEV